MSDILNISQCNLAQIVGETNRFLFHVMLVHFATCMIEGKKAFFGEELFRTLLITAAAIAMYHVFFRKIIEPKVEKMKLICYDGNDRLAKKDELSKQYESESKQTNESKTNVSSENEKFTSLSRNKTNPSRNKRKTDHGQKIKSPSNNIRRFRGANTPRDYSKRQQVLRD